MSDEAATSATPLDVVTLPLGAIGTNCYVAHLQGDTRAVVVDPGDEGDRLVTAIEARGLTVEAILVTHCHWDHIGAVAPVARRYEVPVYMSRIEAPVLEDINSYAPPGVGPFESWQADKLLDGGETLELAGMQIEVIHLPGHSPGTMGFFVAGSADTPPALFVGDLIFRDSVGRTDLPFADTDTLLASARLVLERMSDETVLYSGHGPATTVGRERDHNPFLQQL